MPILIFMQHNIELLVAYIFDIKDMQYGIFIQKFFLLLIFMVDKKNPKKQATKTSQEKEFYFTNPQTS